MRRTAPEKNALPPLPDFSFTHAVSLLAVGDFFREIICDGVVCLTRLTRARTWLELVLCDNLKFPRQHGKPKADRATDLIMRVNVRTTTTTTRGSAR